MPRRRSPAPAAASATRRLASRRGRDFEHRVAATTEGEVWPGADGDVTAHGARVECKSVGGLVGLKKLADFIRQAKRNSAASGLPWVLALTGGREFENGETYAVIPLAEWHRLAGLEDDLRLLDTLRHKHGGDAGVLMRLLTATALQLAGEMYADRDLVGGADRGCPDHDERPGDG
jgi:hypothetical protein